MVLIFTTWTNILKTGVSDSNLWNKSSLTSNIQAYLSHTASLYNQVGTDTGSQAPDQYKYHRSDRGLTHRRLRLLTKQGVIENYSQQIVSHWALRPPPMLTFSQAFVWLYYVD